MSLYVFGGTDSAKAPRTYLGDLWEYNLDTNSWKELIPKYAAYRPEPRAGHVMFLAGRMIYIWGGESATGLLNDMWAFDLGMLGNLEEINVP